MKGSVLIVLLLVTAVPSLAFGQAQAAPSPKPGPEVQQSAEWQGTWQCAGESKTGTQTKSEFSLACEWAVGGFFAAEWPDVKRHLELRLARHGR